MHLPRDVNMHHPITHCYLLLLVLFWHAPLGVRSAIRRHQKTVLAQQVDCFVQREVVGSQIALDCVQPRDTRTPRWSLATSLVGFFFFLLFWHAPLGVRSAIRRHQPPQRTVLGQVNDCFVRRDAVNYVLLAEDF